MLILVIAFVCLQDAPPRINLDEIEKGAGGWPIDKAVSPSSMLVDYVRAYAKNP